MRPREAAVYYGLIDETQPLDGAVAGEQHLRKGELNTAELVDFVKKYVDVKGELYHVS